MSKPKAKIKQYGPKYNRMANELARDFCPSIRPCRECGAPVLKGYCCTNCGSSDP